MDKHKSVHMDRNNRTIMNKFTLKDNCKQTINMTQMRKLEPKGFEMKQDQNLCFS